MSTFKAKPAAPLTFDLPLSLISKIGSARRGHSLKSASDVVRLALEQFDLGAFNPMRDPHRQISVRIGIKQRAALKQAAKRNETSIGELVRAALEQLPNKPKNGLRSRIGK